MPVTSYPPDQMYATSSDDPALACQCDPCRNARAIMPAPLDYDADGYDQFGNDDDGYDRHGNDHQERHGRPGYRGTDASDLDLLPLWRDFPTSNHDTFLAHLRDILTSPDAADEVQFCEHCGDPAWDEDMSRSGNGLDLCESCYSELSSCVSCDERYPDDDLYSTLGGSSVCDGCRMNYCTWCEDCDGYYWDDDAGEHDHCDDSSGGGCCESPQTAFTVRNDGEEPLANDTRVTITLPAGTISAEGLKAIRNYLRDQSYASNEEGAARYYDLSCGLDTIGDQWQMKTGNYAKRLSRHAYKAHQLKLTPEDLSRVGTIARDHSNAVSATIEVSRELNQSAADWYHEDSCWWNGYSEGRCTLKTNGGFGLRSFSGDGNYAGVSGRAWVLPLKLGEHGHLVPTFETTAPDAFVVFNGYGDLSGYAAPRILAHMAGWTYRKIGFSCSPMYVNAGGYLVAPEDIASGFTDGSLHLSVDQHASLYATETAREPAYA